MPELYAPVLYFGFQEEMGGDIHALWIPWNAFVLKILHTSAKNVTNHGINHSNTTTRLCCPKR